MTAPARWATPRTADRPTWGGRIARVAAVLGSPLLEWQRQVVDVAGEHDRSGVPFYREVRVTVPRQSGKTTLLLAAMVDRCLAWDRPQRVVYTAQDRNHAREKWSEQVEVLDGSPLRRLYRVRRSNGSEAIRWRTGSTHGISSSGESAGHGFTLDLGVIDEAFAQRDERLVQGFRPAMVTRRDAQLWVVSTAGTDESTFLRDRVEDGRARVEGDERFGVCYFEWSAPDDVDDGDPAVWAATMPALGTLVDVATIASDRAAMDAAEFGRAYLNRWAAAGVPVFDLAGWTRCRDERSTVAGVPGFGVDVSPDRRSSTIAASGGRPDGRVHVELVERRPGTDWVVGRIAELAERWHPAGVAIDPSSPAGSLVTDLTRLAKVPPLVLVTARQYAQACGALYDDVATGRLAHRGQPALDDAVAAARRRPTGDAWAWARPTAGVDAAPLIAATLARWAWTTAPRLSPVIY